MVIARPLINQQPPSVSTMALPSSHSSTAGSGWAASLRRVSMLPLGEISVDGAGARLNNVGDMARSAIAYTRRGPPAGSIARTSPRLRANAINTES
jgi:hypothetical protein